MEVSLKFETREDIKEFVMKGIALMNATELAEVDAVITKLTGAATQAVQQPALAVQQPAPQTPIAPAVQQPTPQTPAAPAVQQPTPQMPVSQTQYTLDDLSKAAVTLVDAGRQGELVEILSSLGVQTLPELPVAQYGAFATALRGKGCRI